MKLPQADEQSLNALGVKAVKMLQNRDYCALADEFGYALSFGREPAAAIEADYQRAVSSPYSHKGSYSVSVKYFSSDPAGIFAIVECIVPISNIAAVLLELVVSGKDEKYITIEDISGFTDDAPQG